MSATGLDAHHAQSRQSSLVPSRTLAALAVACGLAWSIVFVVIGLSYGLEKFGDGAIFSYAIAVQDAWAFHWHNVPARAFTYVFAHLPAQAIGALSGDPRGAILVYGFLFFVAQFLALVATFAIDRSNGRILFAYACGSTAALCPLVFGFPTELWMAHALFWPALALCHYARDGFSGTLLIFSALLALLFTHEGALILAAVILGTLALRGLRDDAFLQARRAFALGLGLWIAVKFIATPDDYFARILTKAALTFFDLEILKGGLVMLFAQMLAGYAIVYLGLRHFIPAKAHMLSAAFIASALVVYWWRYDHALHAEHRYYLRTLLLVLTPAFGLAAAISALGAEGRLSHFTAFAAHAPAVLKSQAAAQFAAGALVLISLVHAVETTKFVRAWDGYASAVLRLATGQAQDRALGGPEFVSALRIGDKLNRVAWFSTTAFLSVVIAPHLAPTRLVIDPRGNYFWLPCRTAQANVTAQHTVPIESRRLIRDYSCQHRP